MNDRTTDHRPMDPLDAQMAERVTELEIKISYTEDTVEALNRTVFQQQRQIDALVQELRALRQQMQANQPGEARSLRDELPPHY